MTTLRRLALTVALLVVPAVLVAQTSEPITANGDLVVRTNRARSAVVAIEVSGTFVGTVQFEVLGSTWTNISCVLVSDGTTRASSATAVGKWVCANAAGFSAARVRASAWTSGQADVYIGFGGA